MTRIPNYPKDFFSMDLESLYRQEERGKIKERYFAIWQLQRGKQIKEVSDLIGRTENTICNWLKLLREEGLESLSLSKKGRGRKAKISLFQKNDLKQKIIYEQKNKKGGRLIGEEIKEMIYELYKVEYHSNYIYEILKEIGLSWVSSRSKHPKQDKIAQEAFKKTLKR